MSIQCNFPPSAFGEASFPTTYPTGVSAGVSESTPLLVSSPPAMFHETQGPGSSSSYSQRPDYVNETLFNEIEALRAHTNIIEAARSHYMSAPQNGAQTRLLNFCDILVRTWEPCKEMKQNTPQETFQEFASKKHWRENLGDRFRPYDLTIEQVDAVLVSASRELGINIPENLLRGIHREVEARHAAGAARKKEKQKGKQVQSPSFLGERRALSKRVGNASIGIFFVSPNNIIDRAREVVTSNSTTYPDQFLFCLQLSQLFDAATSKHPWKPQKALQCFVNSSVSKKAVFSNALTTEQRRRIYADAMTKLGISGSVKCKLSM